LATLVRAACAATTRTLMASHARDREDVVRRVAEREASRGERLDHDAILRFECDQGHAWTGGYSAGTPIASLTEPCWHCTPGINGERFPAVAEVAEHIACHCVACRRERIDYAELGRRGARSRAAAEAVA